MINNDFRHERNQTVFSVRGSAIIIENNQLLTYYNEEKEAYYLPGGAIEIGESTKEAVKREVMEELGVACQVSDLRFVVENEFSLSKKNFHNIEFHYAVTLLESSPNYIFEDGNLPVRWLALNDLASYNLNPGFLKEALLQPQTTLQHIVNLRNN
ncbi:NUDIX hydrolase [Streptococcus sp. CSL10205-OR2]|uniref:NUDIX hydrolase n=1 Tax=Streptococcus sp. CSL10205-OR2 TaxID=2980558 RepID=UPI0021DB346E|nr:NUDIX domain-containing protein [Streptococcus sp. CSL10205-OR2]MCU9534248.1 NUDIX domain-containing protein [Streptococcus sp. CSL10205-OR2]